MTSRSTKAHAANRIPTFTRQRARLQRARGANRSSSRSVPTSRWRGIGPSRSVWTPGVGRVAMPRCDSMNRVTAGSVVAFGSLHGGRGGKANSCSPWSAIEPRVECRSDGCIRASGSAGSSSPQLVQRGRSRGWMSTRPMIVAGTCRSGDSKSQGPRFPRVAQSQSSCPRSPHVDMRSPRTVCPTDVARQIYDGVDRVSSVLAEGSRVSASNGNPWPSPEHRWPATKGPSTESSCRGSVSASESTCINRER